MSKLKESAFRLIASIVGGQCAAFAWLGAGLLMGAEIHPKDLMWTIQVYAGFGFVGGLVVGVIWAISALRRQQPREFRD